MWNIKSPPFKYSMTKNRWLCLEDKYRITHYYSVQIDANKICPICLIFVCVLNRLRFNLLTLLNQIEVHLNHTCRSSYYNFFLFCWFLHFGVELELPDSVITTFIIYNYITGVLEHKNALSRPVSAESQKPRNFHLRISQICDEIEPTENSTSWS